MGKILKMKAWVITTVFFLQTSYSMLVGIKDLFVFSVGPEMKFLSVYPLDPGPYYNTLSHQIDYYIGIKFGLRWGFDFHKKATKGGGKS